MKKRSGLTVLALIFKQKLKKATRGVQGKQIKEGCEG